MRINLFIKELVKAFLLGVFIFLFFLGYYYFTDRPRFDLMQADIWQEFFENMIFAVIIYMFNAFWFYYLLRKYNTTLFTPKRLALAISGHLLLTFVAVFVTKVMILMSFYEKTIQEIFAGEGIVIYAQPLLITLFVLIILYLIWYYKLKQEAKVTEQKIIAGTASAKFDALKNQLDPHFLFNSLNVLTSLIEENPVQAQKFTTSLSKVYRYVLEQKNKDLVSVDEELRFAKTYVRLLKMRFEDSIVFEIPEKSKDPEAKMIPLSLQLLIENAVKHNIVTSSKPLRIKVTEEDGNLVVSNNLQEKQVVKKSTGVGLRNIKQRYAIMTENQVQVLKTASHFRVQLPILLKTVSKVEKQELYLEGKRYEKAKAKVEDIKGFYGNLIAFCCIMPILAFVNYQTTSFPWVIFPFLGWGWGVISQGMAAFGYNPLWGKSWEEKKMRQYMEDENF